MQRSLQRRLGVGALTYGIYILDVHKLDEQGFSVYCFSDFSKSIKKSTLTILNQMTENDPIIYVFGWKTCHYGITKSDLKKFAPRPGSNE